MKLTKEVQIALVAIVSLVVLFFGLKFLKGMTVFSTDANYYASFDNISGLSVSSPVYANGYRVGVVESVVYDYTGRRPTVAVLGLNKQMRLPVGTRAEISKDLMGNIQLDLHLGEDPLRQLSPGDTIVGGLNQGMLANAAQMIPQIQQMLPKLDSILVSVNALLADPALAASLHNVEHITANLTSTTEQLHHLSVSLNTQVPGLMQKADGVLANTSTFTKHLSDLDIAMTMAKVNSTLANVEQMTATLNSSEGTLGLLMRDPALYRNLNSTVRHADSLMIDLRQHPKRYVHFSVFGRKDK